MWYFIGAIAAVLLGAGFVLQQDAAQRVPQSDFLRARLVADLLRQRRWLAGLGFMIAGMLLSAWVIGHLVLALSEPLLATNLLVALVIAGRVSGQKPQAQELVGAVILLAGVSALSVARSVTSVQDSVGSPAYWPYAGAAIAAAAACFAIAGRRRQGDLRGLLTGTAAGLVLGIQEAITRVTVRDLDNVHDVILLLTSWPAYSLVAVGVIALWLMQSAFSSAPLHASLPGVTAAEPVSGIVLGVVAFRENVPASPLLIAVQVAGLIMLVVGVILVARAPALSGLQKVRVPGERLLRRKNPAGVTPLQRLADADDARQEPARGRLRHDAALREHKTEPRIFGRNADIHRQLHGDADADRRAVHRRDDRLQALEDAQRDLSAAVADLRIAVVDAAIGEPLHRPAPCVAIEGAGAGRKVGAGAKTASRAGHDDGANVVVLVGGIEGVDQFLLHGAVEGVELVGAIERNGENLLGDLVFDRLIGHRGFLSFRHCRA